MASQLATEPGKLEWAGKLSALLLNEGTNALRWFLDENLPRARPESKPDLNEILQKNRPLFAELCQEPEPVVNQEMFDILFGENNEVVDTANLEIYLIFVLTRYLCKLKHWSWKWWNEDPQEHQVTPLFDVIRIFRFKERMREIVHNYEITEEIFSTSWDYVTSVLDRLNAYKISSRRWHNADNIKRKKQDKNNYVNLVKVMQWQTLTLQRRQELYLCRKENRRNALVKDAKPMQPWDEFISHFGQMHGLQLSNFDEPKLRNSFKISSCKENSFIPDYPQEMQSSAHQLNRMKCHDKFERIKPVTNTKRKIQPESSNLFADEVRILNQITNDVFISDFEGLEDDLFCKAATMLRDRYITHHYKLVPLTQEPKYYVHMDNAVFNLDLIQQPPSTRILAVCRDVLEVSVGSKTLYSWRDIFASIPFRLMISGERSSGKTSFLKKLSYDWATQNTPQLECYRLVFYLDLALVITRKPFTSLSECIVEQCMTSSSIDEVEKLLNASDGEGILLLFDGAEHMPDARSDVMSEMSEIICGKRWAKCSVIVTTNFSEEFEDNAEKDLHENAFYFANQSTKSWSRCKITGFTTHDVITHARHYFETSKSKKCAKGFFEGRKFLKLCRVFQRDVYKGIISSPTFTFLLASLWKQHMDAEATIFPETLCEIIAPFYIDMEFCENDFSFCNQVLQRTLDGYSGNTYKIFTSPLIAKMLQRNLLLQHNEPTPHIRFSHHLFEDFCAAKTICQKFAEDYRLAKRFLTSKLQRLRSVIRLRNFLLFTCFLNQRCADVILPMTSTLMEQEESDTDTKNCVLVEAAKHFTLQCFYEMDHVPTKLLFTKSTEDGSFNKISKNGSSLTLKPLHLLSNRSKQAILYLTTQCEPPLNLSGTVFPFTSFSFCWICSVQFAEMDGNHLEFVSSLLMNLPFLEEAVFVAVKNVENHHINYLCKGLRHPWKKDQIGSVLHSLTFTLRLSSNFDFCQVTTYEAIGELVKDLPYLEELFLTIPSSKLFFSLFQSQFNTVIPLTVVNLHECGFTSSNCEHLASLLHRLIFVEKIDLSNNPLKWGFASISNQLRHLRCLKVIDLSNACLTSESVEGLSSHAKRLSQLQHLDISGNQLQCVESMTSLVLAIEHLPCLEYLNLSDNYLGDKIACKLARSLSSRHSIRVLKLNSVEMGPVAFTAMKHCLRKCLNLSHVSLAGNYPAPGLLQFTEVLKPTPDSSDVGLENLQELNISGAYPVNIHSHAIDSFLESIRSHKKLRCLILENVRVSHPYLTLLLEGCENLESLKEVRFSKNLLELSEKQSKLYQNFELEEHALARLLHIYEINILAVHGKEELDTVCNYSSYQNLLTYPSLYHLAGSCNCTCCSTNVPGY